MLSIGEFARLGGVSVRTLHHYEEVGLLAPVAVNAKTGYRTYSAHQLPRLHRIMALKELGLTLGQIRPIVDDMTPETLRGMLLMKRAELEQRVNEVQTRLAGVEQRLRYIEQEKTMDIEILAKDIPQLQVAAVGIGKPGLRFANFDDGWSGDVVSTFFILAERLERAGVTDSGPAFLFYLVREDGDLDPYVAVDMGNRELAGDEVTNMVLPPTKAVSTVVDYGGPASHAAIGPIYGELARWAEDQGYDVTGPGRDILISYEDGFVMEHQLPVKSR
jgi:DNA-binding transcriptional MerR regulator/effector-binding domain-containing protein